MHLNDLDMIALQNYIDKWKMITSIGVLKMIKPYIFHQSFNIVKIKEVVEKIDIAVKKLFEKIMQLLTKLMNLDLTTTLIVH